MNLKQNEISSDMWFTLPIGPREDSNGDAYNHTQLY